MVREVGVDLGLPFWVNGRERRLRCLVVSGTEPGTLPVWMADVDGHRGCGGTLDAALVLAARAAEMDVVPRD